MEGLKSRALSYFVYFYSRQEGKQGWAGFWACHRFYTPCANHSPTSRGQPSGPLSFYWVPFIHEKCTVATIFSLSFPCFWLFVIFCLLHVFLSVLLFTFSICLCITEYVLVSAPTLVLPPFHQYLVLYLRPWPGVLIFVVSPFCFYCVLVILGTILWFLCSLDSLFLFVCLLLVL